MKIEKEEVAGSLKVVQKPMLSIQTVILMIRDNWIVFSA